MMEDHHNGPAWDVEAERQMILRILSQALADPNVARNPGSAHLLAGVCYGLVQDSVFVAWCGYCVRTRDERFDSRCLAGATRRRVRIPKDANDPVWQAAQAKAVVVLSLAHGERPAWVDRLGPDVREIACFPFGGPNTEVVGIIAVRRTGYFEHIGLAYFLTFSHVGRLALRLRDQALRDPLTGLPNRRLFLERLVLERNRSRRQRHSLAIAILDLDGFKEANDRFGHMAGDDLLCQTARRIARALRAGDTLARLGGDEFGLLLIDIPMRDVGGICERILTELRRPFRLANGQNAVISASIGLTSYPIDASTPNALLRHADAALYEAKKEGRDQYQMHSIALGARTEYRAVVHGLMAQALRDHRLVFYYQPIAGLTQPEHPIFGVEALLRLRDERGRIHTAGELADTLDHPRFARDIGRLALDRALAQAAAWQAQGLTLRIAINISARHLLDRRFSADLEGALARYPGVLPRHVEIEITESAPLQNFDGIRAVLEQCGSLGIRIGLDDFGAGHASLSYLQRFPAQTIKIDRSFLRDIAASPRDLAIIAGITATARMLNLEVVAEGIETLKQAQLMKRVGCERLQGYFVAAPMPPEDIPGWVTRYRLPAPLLSDHPHDNTEPALRAQTTSNGADVHDRAAGTNCAPRMGGAMDQETGEQ